MTQTTPTQDALREALQDLLDCLIDEGGHPRIFAMRGREMDEAYEKARAILSAPTATPAVEVVSSERIDQAAKAVWSQMKLIGCSKGYHEGASDRFEDASPEVRDELREYAKAALSTIPTVQVDRAARECTVCGAGVAEWPEVMCCHCHEIPWKLRPVSPTPATVETAREEIARIGPHSQAENLLRNWLETPLVMAIAGPVATPPIVEAIRSILSLISQPGSAGEGAGRG